MWLWTRQEAKQIDRLSIQSGIPEEKLMETAGQKSAAEILKLAPKAQSFIVICGPGHNGGDGFVVARELSRQGLQVKAVESSSKDGSTLRSKKKSQYKGVLLSATEFLQNPIEADVWIDGLFGIGLNRQLDMQHQKLLIQINQSLGLKIALDTPSGLDVDTGQIYGAAFQADATLTVGHPKPGFYLNEGPRFCGKIKAIDIGFPKEITRKEARSVFLLSEIIIQRWIPERHPTDNKSKGGKTLIWAGSSEMPGAAILASQAAGRVGSGYVYCSESEVLKHSPEFIPWKNGDFSKLHSVLVGPGLGVGPQTLKALHSLKQSRLPVVIDADALTVAAREKLFPFPATWLATPHAGELSRFLNSSAKEIEGHRLLSAQKAYEILGCPVLLKGFHTVVAFGKFSVIVPTGNVALAKGGSGDVLAGMIAGFLSQGLSTGRAALLAAYLHGKIADRWIHSGKDLLSLSPSDLLAELPCILKQLRK